MSTLPAAHLTDRCGNRANEFPGPGMMHQILLYQRFGEGKMGGVQQGPRSAPAATTDRGRCTATERRGHRAETTRRGITFLLTGWYAMCILWRMYMDVLCIGVRGDGGSFCRTTAPVVDSGGCWIPETTASGPPSPRLRRTRALALQIGNDGGAPPSRGRMGGINCRVRALRKVTEAYERLRKV